MTQIVVPPELKIVMIVATDVNDAIGKENKIPWHHKADMSFFRKTTTGHMVLMGRNTWVSLGAMPLPKRHNLVLSSKLNGQFFADNPPLYPSKDTASLQLVNGIQDTIDRAEATRSVVEMHTGKSPTLFIIGGQGVYEAFLPYTQVICQNVISTRIETPDKFFPQTKAGEWLLIRNVSHPQNDIKGDLPWREKVFVRRGFFMEPGNIDYLTAEIRSFANNFSYTNEV
jgi:dihydrofolate reductase